MPERLPSWRLALAGLAATCVVTFIAPAQSAADAERELEEIAQTLKAAVLSGTLSEEDAIGIYKEMATRLGAAAWPAKGAAGEPAAARFDSILLSCPPPDRIRALLRPDFLPRDVVVLRDALRLDDDQAAIAEVLLRDYLEAFDLACAPLREALAFYERSSSTRWMVEALARAHLAEREARVAKTRIAIGKLAEDEAWAQRMLETSARMEARLAALRERVEADLAALDRDGAPVTGDDLVRLARDLRRERGSLRRHLADALALVVDVEPGPGAAAPGVGTLAPLRIARLLPQGRLGGEAMDLWAVADGAGRPDEMRAAVTRLHDRAPAIAARLDERLEATLDREIAGLELRAARDRLDAPAGAPPAAIDRSALPRESERYARAARRELVAATSVRDALLALLDESAAGVPEPAARRYREAALRRGFPREMRRRWSERAIEAALALDDLDHDVRAVLRALETDTVAACRRLRAEAVGERARRDVRLARRQIDAWLAGSLPKAGIDPQRWLGFNYDAFRAVDAETESALRSLLTPAQIDALPPQQKMPLKFSTGKGRRRPRTAGSTGGTS